MTENAAALIEIGKLAFAFAKVNRGAYHEDGVRLESDTDHTVMMSLCVCALGQKLYPSLDQGKIAQFALVHDLVEAYAMDTDSFGLSETGRRAKEEREHYAFIKLKEQFGNTFSWIPDTIAAYEKLDTKEARFVKTVDKLTPKIVHVLNQGQYFKNKGMTKEEMWDTYQDMTRKVEVKYGKEFPEIVALIDELILETRKITYGN